MNTREEIQKAAGSGPRMTRRALLLSLPALSLARHGLAQRRSAPLQVRALHQVTLAVSDVERSLDFYQRLFGMPVQARHDRNVLLRIGAGPRFLKLVPAGSAPPRIDHFGMSVQDFDPDRIIETLAGQGVTRTLNDEDSSVGALQVRLTMRGTTPELHMGDINGLVIQLQDPSYCGGEGSLGSACPNPEFPGAGATLTLLDLNHFTINVPDPGGTNAFYRRVFGLDVQVMQASTAGLGVGTGPQFLMFPGGDRARINHVCLSMEDFNVGGVQRALEAHGIVPRGAQGAAGRPLEHWVSLRMPDRGGAPEGTPELYFSDPDGLSIQLQDVRYCGGGGYLGAVCR